MWEGYFAGTKELALRGTQLFFLGFIDGLVSDNNHNKVRAVATRAVFAGII